jgi:hypothetical protein
MCSGCRGSCPWLLFAVITHDGQLAVALRLNLTALALVGCAAVQ